MRGRPQKPPGETKDYMLRIRMTESDKELLERAAREKSLDMSAWARTELVSLAKKLLAKKPG